MAVAELFDELTVEENLLVAAQRQSPVSFLLDLVHPRDRDRGRTDFALDVLGIRALAG